MTVLIANPYLVLHVAENASEQDIDSAYRKLMAQAHPDRGGDPAHAQRLNAAYEVLSDPVKRAECDAELASDRRYAETGTVDPPPMPDYGDEPDYAAAPSRTTAAGAPNPDYYGTVTETHPEDGYIDGVARATMLNIGKAAITAWTVVLTLLWWGLGIVLAVIGMVTISLVTDHETSRSIAPLATPVFIIIGAAWFALPLVLIFRSTRKRQAQAQNRW